ncbi:MAG TPA: hypothetical protein VMZ91_08490 [Candidatus Paceibacterota bacterium]|nr:hypothetical protein [Candidatus Paceibacterota bacterium]
MVSILPQLKFVNLGKDVKREDLISILLQAAEEVGLKAKRDDKKRTEYELGSVRQVDTLTSTDIILKGRLLRAMTLDVDADSIPTYFGIYTGGVSGCASRKTVENYLEAVSAHL